MVARLMRTAPPLDSVTAAVARTKGGSVSSEAREKAKQAGHAMKDGSFPIEDSADLDNAIQSVGRAKNPEAARRHIIKQAKRLGLESKIPDSWNADGTVKGSVTASISKVHRESGNINECHEQTTHRSSASTATRTSPTVDPGRVASVGNVSSEGKSGALLSQRSSVSSATQSSRRGEASGELLDAVHVRPTEIANSPMLATDTSALRNPNTESEWTRPVGDTTAPGSDVGVLTRPCGETGSESANSNGNISTHSSSIRVTGAQSAGPPYSSAPGMVTLTTPISTTVTNGPSSEGSSAPPATEESASSETSQECCEPQQITLKNVATGSHSQTLRSSESVRASGIQSAAAAAPIEWFRNPNLPELTPLTVEEDGRCYGHLAGWQTDHIGFPGQRINPPRSRSDYAYFHTGARVVLDGDQTRAIPTGHITLDTGHAEMGADHRTAAAHYDDTGTLVADVCAGEDAYGIWIAGALAPGVDDLKLHKLRSCGLSGDWRKIGPGLELVAALSVPTPGFPVPRSRVASGEPMALVAAGALPPPPEPLTVEAIAAAVVTEMGRRTELSGKRDALLAETDDAEDRMAELLVSLYWDEFDFDNITEDELTADAMPISRMPTQLQQSYIAGKVAQRIRWGVPGDFKRCVAQAKLHGMGRKAEGACAMLHHKALGAWPGREHSKK